MGYINVFPGFSNSCGCCPPINGYCNPPSCNYCVGPSGEVRPDYTQGGNSEANQLGGLNPGLNCYIGCNYVSYYTKQCAAISSGQLPSSPNFTSEPSGYLQVCDSESPYYQQMPCTGHQYTTALVTVGEFSPGFKGCKLGGSSYGLINPAYNNQSSFPLFGVTSIFIEGTLIGGGYPGLPICAKDTSKIDAPGYISEFGTDCRWEWGGADYMFYDPTDNSAHKRCTTGTGCSDCIINQAPGFFGGGDNIPAVYSAFYIVMDGAYRPINGPIDYPIHPQISITVWNVLAPTRLYEGDRATCRPLTAIYRPSWKMTNIFTNGIGSGQYMNCEGPTTFYKIPQFNGRNPYGQEFVDFGNFPDTIEVEMV